MPERAGFTHDFPPAGERAKAGSNILGEQAQHDRRGSGGGGFILGFTRDFDRAKKLLAGQDPEVIYRF